MDITTNDDWTWVGDDYKVAYATTSDPRVLAVIERDDDVSFERCLDGDAINPTYMVGGIRVSHVGGYDDDEDLAERIIEAERRFMYAAGYRWNGLSADMMVKASAMTARWAWIFHGTTYLRGNYGYNSAYDVLVLSTPAFREHVGADGEREKAQLDVDNMSTEIANIADGDVFGIGWATNEGRVLDENEIDFDEWTVDMQVWGYVGEKYAQDSAAAFEAGDPDLPPMLELEPRFTEHTDHLANFDLGI